MRNKFYTLVVALVLYSIGTHAQQTITERIDSVRMNQYGQQVSWLSLNPEAQEGILNFTSDDGSYRFWMDNRVQLDAAVFSNDTYNPIGNGLNIRRARMAFKAILWDNWYAELDLDFAGSHIEMKDMIIGYIMSEHNLILKAGQFKESFGMETTTTSRYLTFMERSFISKMDASRHLGFQATHWADKYLLIGGIHFNTQGDMEEVEFSQDQNKDFGIDEGYSFTGRAVYRPIIDDDKVLHLGVAATYRTPKTDLEVPNTFRYSTRSHTSINRKKYIDTDVIGDVNNEVGLNFELAGAYKNFMFQGEYVDISVNRMNGLETVNLNGFYMQAGYLLFGGKYNYNKAEGEFTRITRGKDWGELEVAFRYDYVDANDFDAGVYGGSADGYSLGLNYYVNSNVKFMMNYIYNNHDRFANGKGKLYVGHDVNGDLTKDPFEVVESDKNAGEDFGMLSFRIEIDF
ncbi:MAG: porin [Flavobacteriaceae bacterium]